MSGTSFSEAECKMLDGYYRVMSKHCDKNIITIQSNLEKMQIVLERYNTAIRNEFRNYPEIEDKLLVDISKGSILKNAISCILINTGNKSYSRDSKIGRAITYLNKKQTNFLNEKMVMGKTVGLIKILHVAKTMFSTAVKTYNAQGRLVDKNK